MRWPLRSWSAHAIGEDHGRTAGSRSAHTETCVPPRAKTARPWSRALFFEEPLEQAFNPTKARVGVVLALECLSRSPFSRCNVGSFRSGERRFASCPLGVESFGDLSPVFVRRNLTLNTIEFARQLLELLSGRGGRVQVHGERRPEAFRFVADANSNRESPSIY
jgi:hypothetical protein